MDSVPPATLSWDDGGRVSVSAIAPVLRFESIGFYYYNPDSSESYTVWQGNFTDQASDTGTPNLLGTLPAPLDASGNPIPLDTLVPLSLAATNREFQSNEPMFIVVENLLDESLAAGGFNTLPGGQRFFSVEVTSDSGQSFFITLVETSVGSRDFVGYLQANTEGSPIQLAAGSKLSIQFNNYGDVPDSDTLNAPWFVDASRLDRFLANRSVKLSSQPLTVPDPEMFLSKQVMRSTAAIGDFLAYELRFENTGVVPIANADIRDILPKGFRYQEGSTRLNGTAWDEPNIDTQGRQLNFGLTNVAPGEVVVIRYVVEVGVNAENDRAINIAQAFSGGVSSNVASAQVLIENPFFNDRSFLMGRVMVGECGDENAAGFGGRSNLHGRWNQYCDG